MHMLMKVFYVVAGDLLCAMSRDFTVGQCINDRPFVEKILCTLSGQLAV